MGILAPRVARAGRHPQKGACDVASIAEAAPRLTGVEDIDAGSISERHVRV